MEEEQSVMNGDRIENYQTPNSDALKYTIKYMTGKSPRNISFL